MLQRWSGRMGSYVQVKMTADYYGNKLEKIFTLYGNSPLLEVRFALTLRNPELNMLQTQPILSIGKTHGRKTSIFSSREGWAAIRWILISITAGSFFLKRMERRLRYQRNISFIRSFPVDQPLFLHMWMNHPSNPGSMYFYTELQPWTRIFQKNRHVFSRITSGQHPAPGSGVCNRFGRRETWLVRVNIPGSLLQRNQNFCNAIFKSENDLKLWLFQAGTFLTGLLFDSTTNAPSFAQSREEGILTVDQW